MLGVGNSEPSTIRSIDSKGAPPEIYEGESSVRCTRRVAKDHMAKSHCVMNRQAIVQLERHELETLCAQSLDQVRWVALALCKPVE